MLTVVVLSVVVPCVVAGASVALRSRLPSLAFDVRGIALQTVIIMVVLLAVAGAIAGVLVSRGNQAATSLESQNISVNTLYTTSSACTNAGYSWVASNAGNSGTTCT